MLFIYKAALLSSQALALSACLSGCMSILPFPCTKMVKLVDRDDMDPSFLEKPKRWSAKFLGLYM